MDITPFISLTLSLRKTDQTALSLYKGAHNEMKGTF